MMSLQATFDKIVMHLLTQGEPAKSDSMCYYRAYNGLSCAVGCLIPDSLYNKCFEGEGVGRIIDYALRRNQEETFAAVGISLDNLEMLESLQRIHDIVEPHDWYDSLCVVANKYNLTMPCDHQGVTP